MSEQYFEQKPSSKHEEQMIQANLLGDAIRFKTDRGVFSKNQIDFGSRTLIESFVEYAAMQDLPKRVLELGAGYGPILLALAKHYPQSFFEGVEVNERAYELSRENAALNHITNVKFNQGDAKDLPHSFEESYDYVLTNPPIRAGKQTIQLFVNQAQRALETDGELWLVIAKKQGAPSMKKHMQEVFGNVERVALNKGYWVLKSTKV